MHDVEATDDDLHEFNDSSKSLFVLQLRCSAEAFHMLDVLSVDFRSNFGHNSSAIFTQLKHRISLSRHYFDRRFI
jgi:hypothetical protein